MNGKIPVPPTTGGLSAQGATQMMAKAALNQMFAQVILDEGPAGLEVARLCLRQLCTAAFS